MKQADDRGELATRAWRLLLGAGQQRMEALAHEMEAMGLSQVMAQFLMAICQSPPGPTNQLATRFGVDPAWVTGVVDRLEARGDIVRRPSPTDRRVKILEVTDRGRRTFAALEALFSAPPAPLLDATREDLLALLRIAELVSGGVNPPTPGKALDAGCG